jgi:hypothetical protein
VWRCLKDMRAGCESVYLLARGSNRDLLREVVDSLRTNGRVLDTQTTDYHVTTHLGTVVATCARVTFEQGSLSRTATPVASAVERIS